MDKHPGRRPAHGFRVGSVPSRKLNLYKGTCRPMKVSEARLDEILELAQQTCGHE